MLLPVGMHASWRARLRYLLRYLMQEGDTVRGVRVAIDKSAVMTCGHAWVSACGLFPIVVAGGDLAAGRLFVHSLRPLGGGGA